MCLWRNRLLLLSFLTRIGLGLVHERFRRGQLLDGLEEALELA